jgi:hypothetical protein
MADTKRQQEAGHDTVTCDDIKTACGCEQAMLWHVQQQWLQYRLVPGRLST